VSLQNESNSREKIAALLRNDDELAGLLGLELGHILAHQNAIIVRQLFHGILGVNVVSDRKDISDKLMRMFNSIDRDTSCRGKLLKSSTGRKGSSIRQIAWRRVPRQRLAIRRKRVRNFLTVRREQMEAVAVF
jgi:hypothetical protein